MNLTIGPRRRVAAIFILALLLLLGAIRVSLSVGPYFDLPRGTMMYNDLRIFLSQVLTYERDGVLYRTDRPGFFDPGSAVYKYPPTYAAVLKFLPYTRWRQTVPFLFAASVLCLVAALVVVLVAARPGRWRALVMILVFLNWSPFWESLDGLQLEPAMLFLLTVSFALLLRGALFWAGVPVGLAGALKVYPGILTVYGAARRRFWSFPLGALAGATAALTAAGLVLRPAVTIQYLTEVLPKLGGTLLRWDNLSLAGNTGRLAVRLMHGGARLEESVAFHPATLLENPEFRIARGVVLATTLLAGIVLVAWTARALRGAGHRDRRSVPDEDAADRASHRISRADALGFAAALPIILLLMPTSWSDYQTLLALPVLVCVAWASPPRRDRWTWGLLLAAVTASALPVDLPWFEDHQTAATALRSWVPLAVWGACVRVLARLREPA